MKLWIQYLIEKARAKAPSFRPHRVCHKDKPCVSCGRARSWGRGLRCDRCRRKEKKLDSRAYSERYYRQNRERILARMKRRRARVSQIARTYEPEPSRALRS